MRPHRWFRANAGLVVTALLFPSAPAAAAGVDNASVNAAVGVVSGVMDEPELSFVSFAPGMRMQLALGGTSVGTACDRQIQLLDPQNVEIDGVGTDEIGTAAGSAGGVSLSVTTKTLGDPCESSYRGEFVRVGYDVAMVATGGLAVMTATCQATPTSLPPQSIMRFVLNCLVVF